MPLIPYNLLLTIELETTARPHPARVQQSEEHEENAYPSLENTDLQSTIQKATSTLSYNSGSSNSFSHTPPLTASASLQQVMTTEHHQEDVVQLKQKQITESVTHEEGDEDRQEKIKLIKQSNSKR